MDKEDSDYLYMRAEAEIELAKLSTHPAAVHAHYQMAEAYLGRLAANQADSAAEQEGL